jgi:hypothetical protein
VDLAAYGLGMSDKFQGTGVWKGVEFERESKKDKDDPPPAKPDDAPPKK